jgi:hypothetical protein
MTNQILQSADLCVAAGQRLQGQLKSYAVLINLFAAHTAVFWRRGALEVEDVSLGMHPLKCK